MTIKPDRRVLSGGMIGQITGRSSNSTTAISVRCAAQAGEHSIVTSSSDHGAGPAPKVGTTRGSIIPHECAWCGARKIAMLFCLLLLLLGRLTPTSRRRPSFSVHEDDDDDDRVGVGRRAAGTRKKGAAVLWPLALGSSAPLRSALGRTRTSRMMVFDGDDGSHGGPTGARRRGGVCALGAGPAPATGSERLPEAPAELGRDGMGWDGSAAATAHCHHAHDGRCACPLPCAWTP